MTNPRRGTRSIAVLLAPVLAAELAAGQSTVNTDAKLKSKAKKESIRAFEEEHGTVFDRCATLRCACCLPPTTQPPAPAAATAAATGG